MNTDKRNQIFTRCCYGYAVSGMSVLVIGAILPYIISEAGISYLAAGGLLSVMAVGNFLASFLFPVIVSFMGKKKAIILILTSSPICLAVLSFLPALPVMYAIMLIYGMVRGSITILNNSAVNDIYGNKAGGKLNLLHCSFAVGAFLAPFLTAVLMKLNLGWRIILYIIISLLATSVFSYGTMDYSLLNEAAAKSGKDKKNGVQNKEKGFLKSFSFYCIAFLLFFYLGVENCVNGWFVTYLQSTGVMSAAYATAMVSFTWLVIMAGRLICAALLKKLDQSIMILILALGSAACFILLISTKSLPVVTAALLGFGFFLSGIYPTSIANAGPLIQGSTLGMSLLTAISAMGGIVTPQIVGAAADHMGIVGAVSILAVNAVFVIVLAAINFKSHFK